MEGSITSPNTGLHVSSDINCGGFGIYAGGDITSTSGSGVYIDGSVNSDSDRYGIYAKSITSTSGTGVYVANSISGG